MVMTVAWAERCRRERRNPASAGRDGSTRYCSKSVTPSPARNVSSIRKLPVNSRAGFWKIGIGRVGEDLRRARLACTMRSPPSRFLIAAVAMVVRGQSALTAMPRSPQLAGEARARRGSCRISPSNRRRAAQTISPSCRAAATASGCAGWPPSPDAAMRVFRHHEGAARVDLRASGRSASCRSRGVRVRLMALALLTTMSMPPNVSAVLAMAFFTAASSRTSTSSGSALPPAASISAAAV